MDQQLTYNSWIIIKEIDNSPHFTVSNKVNRNLQKELAEISSIGFQFLDGANAQTALRKISVGVKDIDQKYFLQIYQVNPVLT